ncbi:Small-conductance mechanosensitive channel [Polaribacter huanghezhanensis]|uniref:mechanosensitive ion channel family protein n=1 Tax=Polaribacter huanghezhanensis TaxID=1354726 RepID=UPI002649D849|nr:mechanosensitive ion channel family protein [Polaribacter huanghezhanensis]WKD86563.1 Small-conductance mechanosensitive channel [Polaribacter huanghezhanensis]
MKKYIDNFLELDSFWSIFFYSLFVFFITWMISRIVRYFLVIYIKYRKTERFGGTSVFFLKNSIKFFLGLCAFGYLIYTVPSLRSKATIIFSGAGILAAIIGFAAQAALSNLIAGVFIVVFKPFRVGDYIKIDEERIGIVQDITLRHTIINTFENKRLIIPNSIISTESILNHTIEDSYILSFNNFKIGLNADVDLAKKIIREEALKFDHVIDNRTPEEVLTEDHQIVIRFIDLNEGFIHLRAYVWVDEPFEEFKFKCNLKEAVHKRFKEEGVDLPILMRKIYNV